MPRLLREFYCTVLTPVIMVSDTNYLCRSNKVSQKIVGMWGSSEKAIPVLCETRRL